MGLLGNILRVAVAAVIIVAVAEISKRYPRYGALLLSLPILSILAFAFAWFQYHDLPAIAKLANETIILVVLGLPFFLPFVFSSQFGLGFWTCMVLGVILVSVAISTWLLFVPST